MVAKEVSNNDKTNECLLLCTHERQQGKKVKMQSSFNGKLQRTPLMSDMKATKAGLSMKDKTSKSILDKMLVGRQGEIEARSDEDGDEGCCLGSMRKMIIGKIMSIITYQGRDEWNPFFFQISFSHHHIKNWK